VQTNDLKTISDTISTALSLEARRPSSFNPSLRDRISAMTKVRPALLKEPPPQHGRSWTCPKTGIVIPKTMTENLEWRSKILAEAKMDDGLQAQLRAACAASPLFWFNAFAYTYRPKMVGAEGATVQLFGHDTHVPFITWLVQDEAIELLVNCIRDGKDAAIDKSRDMGASWLCLGVFHWFWQFGESFTAMELSRKEEYVDKKGEMDTLFEKHRYLLKWQPRWLCPRHVTDNYMKLINHDRGNSIVGESTNGDASRGGRKTAGLFDEFAAVDNGAQICAASADAMACRVFNSTPGGPHTEFAKIITEKRAVVVKLPWWRHPEKGNGAFQILDEHGRTVWRSPWYAVEAKRRSAKEMAQEIDMDHGRAGEVIFDPKKIEGHRQAHARAPELTGELILVDDFGDEGKRKIIARRDPSMLRFVRATDKPGWRFWISLVNGRPSQDLTYVFGIDVALGSGDSNSVISVGALELGMKVAEFSSPHYSPDDLAEMCAFAGIWFGGQRLTAYACFENNGPGGAFGRKLIKLGYTNVYFQRVDGVVSEVKTARYGWNSNKKRKLTLLTDYAAALEHDRIIIPNEDSLKDAESYILDDTGDPMPSAFIDLQTGARETHGDRVIADALMYHAVTEAPKSRRVADHRAPEGSPAWRREQAKKKRRDDEEWSV
jgi:hypothetical protein